MKRGAIFLLVIGIMVVTGLWWVFIVSPTNGRVSDVEAQLENERAREGTLRQQIANLRNLKDLEVSYLFAMGQMEAAIPEFPDVDTFLEEVNFLAHRTGVELSAITLSTPTPPPEEEAGPFIIPLSLNATGEYFEVLGFIYGLEAMERLVRVQNLQLSPDSVAVEQPDEGPEDPDLDPDLSEGPRPRPIITHLSATISGAIFTKTEVAVETPQEEETDTTAEEEPPPDEGEPADGETPPDSGDGSGGEGTDTGTEGGDA